MTSKEVAVVTKEVTVPSTFVPVSYLNDPETEDMVFGDQLQDGMVVVIEGAIMREDSSRVETADAFTRQRIFEAARWCRVTNVRFTHANSDSPQVSFIGVYADGTKMARSYGIGHAWFVKVASM